MNKDNNLTTVSIFLCTYQIDSSHVSCGRKSFVCCFQFVIWSVLQQVLADNPRCFFYASHSHKSPELDIYDPGQIQGFGDPKF